MKKIHFNKVTIIGVGLIGGSLAISLKEAGACNTIVGVGRGIENLKTAKRLGIIDSYTTDVKEGVKDSDLVVVGVPVLSIAKVIKTAAPYFKKGCIVTDVGSVKEAVVRDVEPLMPKGVFFVATHPIAGTEHSGAEAAFSGLFKNRRCIITPTSNTDNSALEKVKAVWELAGSEVVIMDAKAHDIILASVSHLPHVIAYSLVNTVADMEETVPPFSKGRSGGIKAGDVLKYSAGGFKDFTRIASSSPEMWRDICLMNRDAVLRLLDEFQKRLDEIKGHIKDSNADLVQKDFERAKRVRDSLKR
ncbi:MAG: prephenate dehydrogenase/arogenate dehydrogenase family protein [Thermodesulfobacteriota bacterium]